MSFQGEIIIMKTRGGLIFPYSVEMENRQWAVWWRYRRALGKIREWLLDTALILNLKSASRE